MAIFSFSAQGMYNFEKKVVLCQNCGVINAGIKKYYFLSIIETWFFQLNTVSVV
jgi:hypothetical protein